MKLERPLYMLRHGETAWNLERRMQGTRNSDLTERGQTQAQAMGRTLRTELGREPGPTIFLRSPLGRARETSLIVGRELGLEPGDWRDDQRLAELSYGDWEGFSWKEIEIDHPNALAEWQTDPQGFCPPGGETHFELHRRSAAVLAEAGGHWHDYGKAPRAGRKVGHATLRADGSAALSATLARVGVALSRQAQVAPVIARLGEAAV